MNVHLNGSPGIYRQAGRLPLIYIMRIAQSAQQETIISTENIHINKINLSYRNSSYD